MTTYIRSNLASAGIHCESPELADFENGVALLADGRFQDALAPLRLALAHGDIRPATILNLAIAEDRTGSTEHARRLMRYVARRVPQWDEPIVRLAESLRAAGDAGSAEEAYREALDLNPERPETLIALSGLLLMRKKAGEARELLLRCCGISPNNAEAWNTLGLALRLDNEPALALTAFVRAQVLEPTSLEFVLNGVDVAKDANEADAELARLTVNSDQTPLNLAPQIGRGLLLERTGRLTEAIDVFEAATELAPGEFLLLRFLGSALTRAGRNRQAESVLRQIIAIEPNDPLVQNDLAVILMRLQRNAEARSILHGVVERHGPEVYSLCNLAHATAAVGLQDEAVVLAQAAIRLDPTAVLPRRALCNTLPYVEGVTGGSDASSNAGMLRCIATMDATAASQ